MIVHLYIMQIVRLLLFHGKVDRSAKNSEGLTAFDMLPQYNQRDNQQQIIGDMLRVARNPICFHLSGAATDADYLKSPVQFDENIYIWFLRQKTELTNDTRNILLVVAALLITVTFQATLSPPGGVWQDDCFATSPSSEYSPETPAPHSAGTAIMDFALFITLTMLNLLSFFVTIFTIFVLLPRSFTSRLFTAPLFTVYTCFLVALLITSPSLYIVLPISSVLPLMVAVLLLYTVTWRRRKLIQTFLPEVKLLDPTLT